MEKNRLYRMVNNYINENNFSMIYKNNTLDVINYTKISDFSSTLISFSYKKTDYVIEGDNLVISKMIEDEMLITGNIKKITFI